MENPWVKKSLKRARGKGYYDALRAIYPAVLGPGRPLSKEDKTLVRQYHQSRNGLGLLSLLFSLQKKGHPFPLEHPYAALLARLDPEVVNKNPKIAQQLGNMVLGLTIKEIVRGLERPPDINRTMGQAFLTWVRRTLPACGFPLVEEQEFDSKSKALLNATNTAILRYFNTKLGLQLKRGRDFLVKVTQAGGGRYIVGEARFLSTPGGSQSRDIEETLAFATAQIAPNVVAIAVLDGIVWFHGPYVERLQKVPDDALVMSALLLKNFLKNL